MLRRQQTHGQVNLLYTVENELRSDFFSDLYPLKIRRFVLTLLVFMLVNCGVILNPKVLEGYV